MSPLKEGRGTQQFRISFNYDFNKFQTQDENPPHSQVFTLRQFNLYIIQPPAYDTVLRKEEEGLPTYQEAVKRGEEDTFE